MTVALTPDVADAAVVFAYVLIVVGALGLLATALDAMERYL